MMTMGVKLVSAVLMVALVLSGPLAPLAGAQEKTEGQMAPAKKGDPAWEVAAGFTNVIAVPGKAVLCGIGAAVGTVVLLTTFGSGAPTAGRIWDEGCGGKWTVTARDLKPQPEEELFWSAQPDYNKADYQRTQ